MPEEKKEEIQTTEEEVQESTEVKEPDDVAQLKQELDSLKSKYEEQSGQYKKLSGMLTRTQQDHAELLRFHKATLPKVNESFEERWDKSPSGAVKQEVTSEIEPLKDEMVRIRAYQWLDEISRDEKYRPYREKVVELAETQPEYAQMSYTKEGIRSLYRIAREQDLDAEVQKLKSNGRADMDKERSFTESSTPRTPAAKKTHATANEVSVANQLGISVEDYLKQKERIGGQR